MRKIAVHDVVLLQYHRRMRWSCLGILALGWVAFGAVGAVLPSASDCAGPASRVLAATPADAPGPQARALWLDGRHLRWPAAAADGTVRLHHAGTGQLRVVDGRVAGAWLAGRRGFRHGHLGVVGFLVVQVGVFDELRVDVAGVEERVPEAPGAR